MQKTTTQQSILMQRFSTLAGPPQKTVPKRKYRVTFKNVSSGESLLYRNWTRVVACGALALVLALCTILFHPSHWIAVQQPTSPVNVENWIMLACLAILQIFLIIGTLSATLSTLRAKDPIPARPQKGLRVAFATTRAPGEPIGMVRATLMAATRVTYPQGTVDVWLLDETNDTELKRMCKTLGVKYFSRAGIEEWNTSDHYEKLITGLRKSWLSPAVYDNLPPTPPHNPYFAAKSKHGNFNSWFAYLDASGISYDILAGVDTDQVPEHNYLQRMLGYFRDPDVAYTVGPQVYGNSGPGLPRLVARWAESQASFFQSTVQRAGNSSTSAMFVGTNYAVRMEALKQIGGFQPCITEDMATGLAILAQYNPATGKHWKSVYTPDVLAIGEGPDFWGPYFTQQWRWAAGTFDTWRKMVWKVFLKLPTGAKFHYFLMLSYYPITALTWLLGILSSMIYLLTGATAIIAPWGQFASLYMMTIVMQLSLYFWNRRNNVSPHEPSGSYGIPGIFLSALTAPIYLSALIGVTLGKKTHFVVTSKGNAQNPDWFPAFRTHLQWAAVLIFGLIYGLRNGHHHPAMLVWVFGQLALCLTPVVLGLILPMADRIRNLKLNFSTFRKEEAQNA